MYYILKNDFSHVDDTEIDAVSISNRDAKYLDLKILDKIYFDVPNPMYFDVNFELIGKVDYLVNDLGWPILSKKMYNIILEAGSFEHRVIPVTLVDDTNLEERFDGMGNFNNNIRTNTEYIALQLQDFPDLFDYENSDYDSDDLFPDEIGYVRKLVLKENDSAPSVFRLREKKTLIFITEDTKKSLEMNNIKGISILNISDAIM